MTIAGQRLAHAKKLVRGLEDTYFLVSEVSEMLDVSTSSLKALDANEKYPELSPSAYYEDGNHLRVRLYSPEDVAKLRAHYTRKDSSILGRPREFTAAEMRARIRLQDRLRYYRRRIKALEADGTIIARDARLAAHRLEKELAR